MTGGNRAGEAPPDATDRRPNRFERPASPSSRLFPVLLPLLLLYAWSNRFIQDDAFISFRYAANLVDGHGLAWNPGGPLIEGYTNFLWTLVMAVPIALGWDPVLFSQLLGLACFAATLFAVHRMAGMLLGSPRAADLAVLLLGTNYTFSAYATGGLETQLQAALLTVVAWLVFGERLRNRPVPARLALISVVSGGAVLTRPDSLLPLAVLIPSLLPGIFASGAAAKAKIRNAAALLLPVIAIGVVYALWKLGYYGELLPNTYHAKVAGVASAGEGVKYVAGFVFGYGWMPLVALFAAGFRRIVGIHPWTLPLMALTTLWLAYVVIVGGDFMEYRLMVPILPVLALLLVATLSVTLAPRVQWAVVAGVILASLYHQVAFSGVAGIESIRGLHAHVTTERWGDVGKTLGALFGDGRPEVVVATTTAGAIPYYSGLKTVDMLGLNDPWIARHGHIRGRRTGHQRGATAAYLRDRGVNLVLGHPYLVPIMPEPPRFTMENAGFDMHGLTAGLLPEGARVIEIPLDGSHCVYALYFMPSAAVEEVIRTRRLREIPIDRGRAAAGAFAGPDRDRGEPGVGMTGRRGDRGGVA